MDIQCPRCGAIIVDGNRTECELCTECVTDLQIRPQYKLLHDCKNFADYARAWLSEHSKPVYDLIQNDDLLEQFGEQIYAQTDDWITPDGTYVRID